MSLPRRLWVSLEGGVMKYAHRIKDEKAIEHVSRLAMMYKNISKQYPLGLFLCEGCCSLYTIFTIVDHALLGF